MTNNTYSPCNASVIIPELIRRGHKDKSSNGTCHPDPKLWKTAIIGVPAIGGLLLTFVVLLLVYGFLSRRRRNQNRITQNQGIPL